MHQGRAGRADALGHARTVRLVWRSSALADILAATRWLIEINPYAAAKLRASILRSGNALAVFPNRGRAIGALGARVLQVRGTPHMIVYTIDEAAQTVTIRRVLDGRRLLRPL